MLRKCQFCSSTVKDSDICPICGRKIETISKDNTRPQINKSIPQPTKETKSQSKESKKQSKKNKAIENQNIESDELEEESSKFMNSITSSLLGILCIIGVMLIVVSGIFAPDDFAYEGKNKMSNDTNSSQLTIQVNVLYKNRWSGSSGLNGNLNNYDQNGSKSIKYTYCEKNDSVSATIQKRDSSNDELKVQILKNGALMKEESTKTPYGIVTISI